MMEHPYVILPTASEKQKAVAEDFLDYLRQDEQQRRFAQQGFRGYQDGVLRDDVAATMNPADGGLRHLLPAPEELVLKAILDGVDTLRRKARLLLLLDISGSMGDPIVGSVETNQTGLGLVKAAVRTALTQSFNDQDLVGVGTFANAYRSILPLTPAGDVPAAFDNRLAGLPAVGRTALYAAVRAGVEEMTRTVDRDSIDESDEWTTAIVVLSDGYDTAARDPARELNGLISFLKSQERRIRIYTIGYGITDQERDLAGDPLKAISDASGGVAYNAKKEHVAINHVFLEIFSHF